MSDMTPAIQQDDEIFALSELDSLTRSGSFAVTDFRADLTSKSASYCSMTAADQRTKVSLFNATGSPKKIKEMINKRIRLAHIYIDGIWVTDQKTGEKIYAPRVILIDDKAQGYQSVSVGMYECVKRLLQTFGDPEEWTKPLTVEVVPIALQNGGTTYNLQAIFE